MRARRRPLGALVIGVALAAGAVASTPAQTPSPDEPFPRLDDARRWGPFLVDPGFEIDRIGYDGNVFLTNDQLVEPESDIVIQAGPRLHAQVQFGRRAAITLRDTLKGEVFLDHPDLNHADNEFESQFDLFLGRVLFTTSGSWRSQRQRPSSEVDERTRRDERRIGQTVRLFVGERTDLAATYEAARVRFEDRDSIFRFDPDGDGTAERVPLGDALDRDADTLSVEAGWRLSSGTRFFARFETRDDAFVNPDAGRDTRDDRSRVGIEIRPSAFLTGRVSVGRARLRNRDPRFDLTGFDGLVSDTELTYRPTGRARISGRYERDVRFSSFERNLFFREEEVRITVEWFLGRVFGLQAGATRRALRYPEPNTIAQPVGVKRRDDIDDVYGGVLFRLGRNFTFGVRAGRRTRDSNVAFVSDTQDYVLTSGGFQF